MSENVTLKVYFDHEEAVLSLVKIFLPTKIMCSDVSGFVPRLLARSPDYFSNRTLGSADNSLRIRLFTTSTTNWLR